MAKTLDLSALKSKAQSQTSDTSRSISLGATVKSKPVAEAPTQKPVQAPGLGETKEVQSTPAIPVVAQDSSTVQSKPELEESKKTMISLSSIKSHVATKKAGEEEKTQTIEEKTQEQQKAEELIPKKITVVAPAMKIPGEETQENASIPNSNTNTENSLNATSTEEKQDGEIDLGELKVEKKPVDEKLVEKESEKLRGQIQEDLQKKEIEENKKKEIKVDDDIFDNYKPKYGGKEAVKNKTPGEDKPVFKKHLSAKRRNILIAGLLLFVLGISAGGYIFFNNSGSTNDDIQAIAIENNIAQTKENVENIIGTNEEDTTTIGEIENDDTKIEEDTQNSDTIIEAEGEEENDEDSQNNLEEKENDEDVNGAVAQTENSGDSKVKNYLLNNYYK